MIERFRIRLRSDSGASITFALFILLVCTVVSTLVITSATTASGQLTEFGRIDQRYYSVSSAAGLFRDAAQGASYTATEKRVYTGKEREEVIDARAEGDEPDHTVTYTEIVRNGTAPSFDFLKDASSYLLYGAKPSIVPMSEPWQREFGYKEYAYTIEPQYTGADASAKDGLKVRVRARLYDSCLLELVLTSDVSSDATRNKTPFSMYLSFQGSPSSKAPAGWELDASGNYTEYYQSTIEWELIQVAPGKGFING